MYDQFGNYIGEESPEQNIPLRDVLKNIYTGLTSEKNWRETGEGLTRLRKSLPGVSESVARGAIASVPGAIGDISEFAREWAPEVMEKKFGKERFFPTTREILDYVPRYTPTHEGASTLEDVAAFISPGVGGVTKDVAMLTKGKPLGLSIIGPESKIWNKEMAFTAGKMEAKGATPDEILEKTGMVRGLDNQWRSELSDKFAKMKQTGASFNDQYMAAKNIDPLSVFMTKAEEAKYGRSPPKLQEMSPKEYEDYLNFRSQTIDEHKALENKPVTVSDVLEHPELFEAYPHLKDVKVKVGSGHGGVKGSYNQTANEITLAAHLNPEEARSTMLHELTHGIQGKEEFNRGANAQQLTDYYKQRKQDIFNEILDLNKQRQEAYKADDMDKYRELTQARDVLSRKYGEIDPEKMGYEDYLLHGGEAEARLVQRRANLSPEELRKNFPYQFTGKTGYGLDINPDEAIITTKHPATINTPEQSIEPPVSKKDELGFHSPLQNFINNLKNPKGTGEQFLRQFEKEPTIKADELELSGLKKYLQEHKTVTKQELQDFMEQNRVKLESKVLSEENASGGSSYDDYELKGGDVYHDQEYIDSIAEDLHNDLINDPDIYVQEKEALFENNPEKYKNYKNDPDIEHELNMDVEDSLRERADQQAKEMYYDNPIRHYYDEHGYDIYGNDDMGYTVKDPHGNYVRNLGDYYDIDELQASLAEHLADEGILHYGQEGAPRHENYSLPGQYSNYRELLVTLPDKYKQGQPDWLYTSHFDEPNILGHVRLDDRTINGKKTLMVEEVQSDWHQHGRDEGYDSKAIREQRADLRQKIDAIRKDKKVLIDERDALPEGYHPDRAEIVSKMYKLDSEINKLNKELNAIPQGVPDAPYKKTWHEMLLKKVMDEAVKGDYDAIAFTTGKQQNDRYSLASHINDLTAEKIKSGPKEGQYEITATGRNVGNNLYRVVSEEELPGLLGNELAKKIIGDAPDYPDGKTYQGLDLQVGGEPMKKFYDRDLPNFMNKYTKKWGMGMKKANLGFDEFRHDLSDEELEKGLEHFGLTSKDFYQKGIGERSELYEKISRELYPMEPKDEVHFVELTDAAKKDIKEKGQPLFAGIGLVAGTDYLLGADDQQKTGLLNEFMKNKKH